MVVRRTEPLSWLGFVYRGTHRPLAALAFLLTHSPLEGRLPSASVGFGGDYYRITP
jgi:hypothetical protein